MNKYRFRFLISKEGRGKAFELVEMLKSSDTFKRARFDVYIPRKETNKMIVCLGQKHTVQRGNISKWAAKTIAKVQTRLFTYYRYFHSKLNVVEFGAEGSIANGKGSRFRYNDELLHQYLTPKERTILESEDEDVTVDRVEKILKRLSKLWQRKLTMFGDDPHGVKEIAPVAAAVNGLRLYTYVAEDVTFFPIEGEDAYKSVSRDVKKYQDRMIALEKDTHYKKAIAKKGRGLSEDEYNAVNEYNELVLKFNKALRSNYREKASLILALDNLQNKDLTVFTMGIGHRTNYKWLAPRMLKKENTAFILITAPELYYWKFLVVRFVEILLIVGVLYAVLYYYFLSGN